MQVFVPFPWQNRMRDTLRDLYSTYLATLNDSSSVLRVIILRESDTAARYQAALDAFRDASVLTQRYRIALPAPPTVQEKSDQACRMLRHWRDLLDTHLDSPRRRRSTSKDWNGFTKPARTSRPPCVQVSMPPAGKPMPPAWPTA